MFLIVILCVFLVTISQTTSFPIYNPTFRYYESDVADYAKYLDTVIQPDEIAFAISVASKQAENVSKFSFSTEQTFFFNTSDDDAIFVPLQAPSCRKFNDEANAPIDSQSICHLILKDKWVMESSAAVQAGTAAALYQLYLGASDPATGCDLAMFTYLCNFSYVSCREEQVPDESDPTQTKTIHVPSLPCESYRTDFLQTRCPVIFGAGLDAVFFSPTGPTGEPMTWFAPDPSCQIGLTPTLQYVADSASPNGVSAAMPPYTCPAPLVNVDWQTYNYERFLSGSCAVPCGNSLLYSEQQRIGINKFMMGFGITSQIMGIFLIISYCTFAVLRSRTFIVLAVFSVSFQGIMIFYPFAASINREGWLGGFGAVCRDKAEEYHWTNFLCTLTAFSGVFSMYTSLTAVNALGIQLVQKICLQSWSREHIDAHRSKIQTRIFIGAAFLIPLVFSIVALSYHQMDGNSGSVACAICRPRDVTTGPNLSDGLGLIASVPFVIFAYIELFWVIGYLFYMRSTVKSVSVSLTGSQIRIGLLILVMSSLYLAIYAFRLDLEYNIKPKLEPSIGEFLVCLILTGPIQGTANCGETPAYTLPISWTYYTSYMLMSPSMTIFVAIGFSLDLLYCWANLIYKYTRWPFLRKYAQLAPKTASRTGQKFEPNSLLSQPSHLAPNSQNGSHGSRNGSGTGDAGVSVTAQPANKATLFKRSQFHPLRAGSTVIHEERGLEFSTFTSQKSLNGSDNQPSSPQSVNRSDGLNVPSFRLDTSNVESGDFATTNTFTPTTDTALIHNSTDTVPDNSQDHTNSSQDNPVDQDLIK